MQAAAAFTPVSGHALSVRTRRPLTSARRVRPASAGRRQTPSCLWVERAATVSLEVDPEECFDCYINLEEMPKWSPWLRSVKVDKNDPDVSQWTLAARGIEVSWKARNTKVVRGEIIAWRSETGLSNRGRVLFEPDGENNSKLTLAIEFDVPSAFAKAVDNDFVGKFVQSTLLADLKRFRSVALLQKRQRLKREAAERAVQSDSSVTQVDKDN